MQQYFTRRRRFHGAPSRHGARWLSARGWCAYTTPGTTGADALYNAAKAHLPGHRIPTENLFMGTPSDSAFLLTKEGQQSFIDLHVDGILYCPGL